MARGQYYRLRPRLEWALFALMTFRAATAVEVAEIPLEQASQRLTGTYKASQLNRKVKVRGLATGRALVFPSSHLLPIQNDAGKGLFLEDSGALIDSLQPGDRLEAQGTIIERGGLPVLAVESILKLGTLLVPAPRSVPLADLDSFAWLGSLVMTTGRVVSTGAGSAGSFVDMEDSGHMIRVYLPVGGPTAKGWQLRPGDQIRVIGYSSQYCPVPPHNRFFQIIVDDASRVIPLERAWAVDPTYIFGLLGTLAVALALWWLFERRCAANRRTIRNMNRLGEELLAAKTTPEITAKIEEILPRILRSSWVRVYLYHQRDQILRTVESEEEADQAAIPIGAQRDSPFAAAAFAFRNRSVLVVPDVRISPLISQKAAAGMPRGLIYIPMISCGETLGLIEAVFENSCAKATRDDQICQQHLGNQAAAALRLIREIELREQLSRSEKLSATAQLVSGIATELKTPLQSISQLSSSLLRNPADSHTERSLRAISGHAGRASGIVKRLVSFSQSENLPTGVIDLASLISEVLKFKEQDLQEKSISVEDDLEGQSLKVNGNRGQLEQVFLNLACFAEQQLLDCPARRRILVSLSSASKSVLVRIVFGTAKSELSAEEQLDKDAALFAGEDPTGDVLSLAFCRGVFNAHNGNIKLIRNGPEMATIEVVLPLAAPIDVKPIAEAGIAAPWTVLVIEPDGVVQRKLITLLSAHRHRVIPVVSAEEAVDLMDRLRFDVVFCSVRLPGRTWIEFRETMREKELPFVLVTEGYDERLSSSLRASNGFLLRKPIDDRDVERLLSSIRSQTKRRPTTPKEEFLAVS